MASPLEDMAREWLVYQSNGSAWTADVTSLAALLARVQCEERERAKRIVTNTCLELGRLTVAATVYPEILRRLDSEP